MKALMKKNFSVADGATGRGVVGMLGMVLLVSLMCTTCQKEKITYYKTVGIGYVYMCDSLGNILYPIQDAEIRVTTFRVGKLGNFLDPNPKEYFYSDAIGKYQVRFIKQHEQDNAESYFVNIKYSFSETSGVSKSIDISVDEVKNAKNAIELDTFKLYINEHEHFNF